MFNDPLFILVAIAVLLVLFILLTGVGGFAKGGDFNRKHANRIMRYRIYAQAVAIALILVPKRSHTNRRATCAPRRTWRHWDQCPPFRNPTPRSAS